MKKILLLIFLSVGLFSCKREDPDPEIPALPGKVTLVFPSLNSLCNRGTNVTALESTLLFEWQAGKNTDRYELVIENLNNNILVRYQTTNITFLATLLRGTPFAWYVTSISDQETETAQSDIWKFYLAGESVQHYAPFPAEILSPAMASSVSAPSGFITLVWNGSDVDDDIIAYDLYFGLTSPPDLLQSDITETILENVAVSADMIYFWKVITRDSEGNSSDSGEYQFKVI